MSGEARVSFARIATGEGDLAWSDAFTSVCVQCGVGIAWESVKGLRLDFFLVHVVEDGGVWWARCGCWWVWWVFLEG